MKFEGWKYISEFLGTFLLIGTILVSQNNPFGVGAVVAMIVWFGKRGGGNGPDINPAASLMRFFAGRLPVHDFVGYVASQIAGAISCLYAFKMFT